MFKEKNPFFPSHPHWAVLSVSERQQWFAFTSILLIVGAGQISLIIDPVVGAFINAIVLCLLIAIGEMKPRIRSLMVIVAVLPLANMINLIVPGIDQLMRTGIYYAVIFMLAVIYKLFFFKTILFRRDRLIHHSYLIPGALVTGIAIGAISFGLISIDYPIVASTPFTTLLIASIFLAATEELFFRGLLQQQASKLLTSDQAVLLTAAVYALCTVFISILWSPLVAFLGACVLSAFYSYRPNLLITFTANLAMKITFVLLIGLTQ